MRTKIIFTYNDRVIEANALIFNNFARVLNGIYAGMLIDKSKILKVA